MKNGKIATSRLYPRALMAVGFTMAACASTQDVPVPPVAVDLKLRRIEVENASFEKMDLKVILLATNPTDTPFSLNGGEVALRITGPGVLENEESGETASDGAEKPEVNLEGIVTGSPYRGTAPSGTLEAQQRTEIPIQISLPLPTDSDALGRLLSWLRMQVEVEGHLQIEQNRVAISGTREVATPRLPQVVVKEAQVASVDRGQKGVAFFALGLDNPNNFAIEVDKFAWGATVGEKVLLPVGEGSVERVPPSSVATFEDTLQLNQETYGKQVRNLLRQPRVPYRLEGYFHIRGINQPFVFEGEMEFAR